MSTTMPFDIPTAGSFSVLDPALRVRVAGACGVTLGRIYIYGLIEKTSAGGMLRETQFPDQVAAPGPYRHRWRGNQST